VIKPAPQVAVGAFATSDVPSRTMNPNKQIDRAGFDAPMAQAVPLTKTTAAVGTFDASTTAARPGTDRPVGTLIADAGFGRTVVAAAQPTAPRTVANTGFGGDAAGSPGPKAPALRAATQVQTTAFDAPPAPSTSKPVSPAERIDIPMEVLSKANPIYTAEARSLKLEGEVALEVQFCASGTIHVLRVVSGLGHGLDEAAAKAAEQIRFKPAQTRGLTVDVTTIVHISFRLS
jgi:TonB family protein